MSLYKRQAIALAYGRHPVPMVTAKGEQEMALRMLEEALLNFGGCVVVTGNNAGVVNDNTSPNELPSALVAIAQK